MSDDSAFFPDLGCFGLALLAVAGFMFAAGFVLGWVL
jgi:hypothetical protein